MTSNTSLTFYVVAYPRFWCKSALLYRILTQSRHVWRAIGIGWFVFDPPMILFWSWSRPYSVQESLVGYKRAAATHNWTVSSSYLVSLWITISLASSQSFLLGWTASSVEFRFRFFVVNKTSRFLGAYFFSHYMCTISSCTIVSL